MLFLEVKRWKETIGIEVIKQLLDCPRFHCRCLWLIASRVIFNYATSTLGHRQLVSDSVNSKDQIVNIGVVCFASASMVRSFLSKVVYGPSGGDT